MGKMNIIRGLLLLLFPILASGEHTFFLDELTTGSFDESTVQAVVYVLEKLACVNCHQLKRASTYNVSGPYSSYRAYCLAYRVPSIYEAYTIENRVVSSCTTSPFLAFSQA